MNTLRTLIHADGPALALGAELCHETSVNLERVRERLADGFRPFVLELSSASEVTAAILPACMTPEPPPKIIEVPARVTPDEPIRPVRIAGPAADSGSPIHPLAALLLIVVDNLWNLAEWVVIDWIITIPLSFITVFVPVFLIQKLLKKNSVGRALGYALLLGVIAAVPTSLTGTPVGLALLAWTGIGRLIGKPLAKS